MQAFLRCHSMLSSIVLPVYAHGAIAAAYSCKFQNPHKDSHARRSRLWLLVQRQSTAERSQSTAVRCQSTAVRYQSTAAIAVRCQSTAVRCQSTAVRCLSTAVRVRTSSEPSKPTDSPSIPPRSLSDGTRNVGPLTTRQAMVGINQAQPSNALQKSYVGSRPNNVLRRT